MFILVWRILGKLPANFSRHFLFFAKFSALFRQGFRHPKKITPRIHAQNCRHSLTNLRRDVLHGVDPDGVGVKFPMFAINCSRLPLSTSRMREKRRKKTQRKTKKNEKKKKTKRKKKKKLRKTKKQRKTRKGNLLRPHLHQTHQLGCRKLGFKQIQG